MITIIGAGPAGISCALYLKRANKNVLLIGTNGIYYNDLYFETRNTTPSKLTILYFITKYIENYYGTGKIIGQELYNNGIKSIQELDIAVIKDEIINIQYNDSFILEGINNNYKSDIVVLALGKINNRTYIKGEEKFIGKGISYCATCDGFFFKDKKIAVIGSGEYANKEYEYLKNISSNIIRLNNDDINEIIGTDKVTHINLKNNTNVEVDGIFICDDTIDANALCLKSGILTNKDGVVIDENYQTNIDNIYACGDLIPGIKQISKAVNDGMLVANIIISRR